MKAILEFNLPEDQIDFECSVNALKYKVALEDIRNHVRAIVKYGDKQATMETVYEYICEQIAEAGADH